jgi:hypothetical protein
MFLLSSKDDAAVILHKDEKYNNLHPSTLASISDFDKKK